MTDDTQRENDDLDAAAEQHDAKTERPATAEEDVPIESEAPQPPSNGKEVVALEATTGEVVAIVPRTIEEAWRVASALQRAGMVPKGYENADKKKEAATMVVSILKGLEVGFPPITALSTIMVVNNRPCIWGDGAAALILKSGQLEHIKEWEEDVGFDDNGVPNPEWTAYCEVKRRNQSEPVTRKFSMLDARRAKLLGNPRKAPWMMYPQRMLPARARAWAYRDVFSDVLSGFQIYEEMRDIEVTPPVEVDGSLLDDEVEDAIPAPTPTTS